MKKVELMKAEGLNESTRPCAIEPYDKEWGVGVSGLDQDISPFPRINRMLEETKSVSCRTANTQRLDIVTEDYEKYQADSQILKMAKTLRDILTKVDIHIGKDEIIVGEMAAPAWSAPLYPEFSFKWFKTEMEKAERGEIEDFQDRHNDKYYLSPAVRKRILETEGFWDGKSIEDKCKAAFTEDEAKGQEKGMYTCNLYSTGGIGHVCANYEKLFKLGYGGIRKQIEEQMAKIQIGDADGMPKREFYEAELIVLDASEHFIRRYAKLAKKMAETETDEQRKKELTRISANCDRVASDTPRDFWEAIQLWMIATFIICIESNGHSVTYGRFDKLFYPFYKNDIKNGTFTREFMQELIECSFIKMDHLSKIRDYMGTKIASGIGYGGTALDVGGVDEDGNDMVNDVSYMVLDAHAHTRISNPWMGVRISNKTPREFKIKLFNVIRIGTGEPKVFNDDINIQALLNYGKPIQEARDYVGIGCVEPSVPGKSYGWHDATYFDIPKVLTLAINNGHCTDCSPKCPRFAKCAGAGSQLGLPTGYLSDMKSFDEVLEAFDKQMKYWIDRMVSSICTMDHIHQAYKPLPYLSLLVDDCIAKGVDVSAGGAHYNHAGPQGVGLGTTTDSLVVIKQLMFDEKKVSGKEILDAIKADWKGYEKLQAYVNSDKVHHYGNDDDYADDVAKFVMGTYCKYVEHRPTAHGGEFMPGVYSVSNNVALGLGTPATPDGRVNSEPLSDCLGPVHTQIASHDTNGPLAIAASISKLDQARIGNGVILNWKFSPSAVSGEIGRDNLISLIDTYFQNGGMQSQFNVTSKETLVAAQKEPEKYRDLLVRVAGYSAFFTQLSPELQNDLIGRTELSFD